MNKTLENRSQLFLDISDIVVWIKHGHQHFSGIQRVVANTCAELAEAGEGSLFYYNAEKSQFCVFDCTDFAAFKLCRIDQSWLTTKPILPQAHDWLLTMGASWSIGSHIENLHAYSREHKMLFGHFVYDVSPLSVPQTHKEEMTLVTADWFSKAVRLTDLLFTISNFSKDECIRWADQLLGKNIDIFPVRIGDEVLSREQVPVDELVGKKFIVNIGTLEARKNQVVLYQAYKILVRKYPREQLPLLVLVGYEGWFSADVRKLLFEDPDLKGLIVWLKAVTDPQLEWLYANCEFSVFSSVYEGWGLPVAESLARGKPCIASSIAVFSEISKDLLIQADPYSGDEWATAIARLHFEPQALSTQHAMISDSFKTTTWRQTADEVVSIFKRYSDASHA